MPVTAVVITPCKLAEVSVALPEVGIVPEAGDAGRQKSRFDLCRGAEYAGDFLLNLQLGVLVCLARFGAAGEAVLPPAGSVGVDDGRPFVHGRSQVMRGCADETDSAAL